MQYMILPMDLTERQLLIYNVLYRRCNFNTMEVCITIDNIITSIKILNLTYKTVYSDIKAMEKKGYIKTIKKAAKGTAPIYKIVKIEELGYQKKTKGYQRETKTECFQGVESNIGYQRETKGYQKSTNSNDNDNDNNIYSRVIDHLNVKASKSFKYTTKKTKSCIDARIREGFKEEDFLKVIDIKTKEWKDNPDMSKYLRPETLFGTKFESYLQQEVKQDQPEQQFKSLYGANRL
ncbi:conserved phage C-terminal domain-containing protein [Clostridium sp. 1001270J_160509_D11]|uniref:conserved phage C-terminal domain-containing protein n=1 Tax=Clostridium sp. 1001270J_160509_D11 TaxID=2787103 RepID=UPI0018AC17FA|nr:conserved phage C-terminal domain-containing protein [Clostridium sp. 1001270J_160509_D11]